MKNVARKDSKKHGPVVSSDTERLARLECLVDELVKDSPQETRIKSYMKAAGLPYNTDPIDRMNCVLEALDDAKATHAKAGAR